MADAAEKIKRLEEQIQALMDKLADKEEKPKPKNKFPDPKAFTGDRIKFIDFEIALNLKLKGDKHLL